MTELHFVVGEILILDAAILFIMTITNWTIIGQWTIMEMAVAAGVAVGYWMIMEGVDIGILMEGKVDIGILMGGILHTMVR